MQKFTIALQDDENVVDVEADHLFWADNWVSAYLASCSTPIRLTFEQPIAEVWRNDGLDVVPEGLSEKCPGCGWEVGRGINPECCHPRGCGYWNSIKDQPD